jgi:hypothetical protein
MNLKACLAPVCILGVAVIGTGLDAQVSAPRVQKSNMVRLGSFKVPSGINAGSAGEGFEYGGTALGYNPTRNSLFITGHDWDQLSGEISIPSIGGTASLLQSPTDPFEGKVGSIGSGTYKTGGHFVHNGQLYVTAYIYYDGSGAQTLSHFVRPVDLNSKGNVKGPYRVGSMNAGFYSGYMTAVPSAWRSALGGPALTGNCCLSIISRTSYGPAAFAFDPAAVGSSSNITSPLVYYDSSHQTLGTYGASGSNPEFNGTTRIRGVVFPEGTSTVLFIGNTGLGNYCYGEGSACGDPADTSKGEHAYPYAPYVWAYDANDLAAVKAGSKQAWQVVPYATWQLDFSAKDVGGAAYDPATNRIYVSAQYGDGERPLIHVYSISNATTSAPPRAPTNVRIIR